MSTISPPRSHGAAHDVAVEAPRDPDQVDHVAREVGWPERRGDPAEPRRAREQVRTVVAEVEVHHHEVRIEGRTGQLEHELVVPDAGAADPEVQEVQVRSGAACPEGFLHSGHHGVGVGHEPVRERIAQRHDAESAPRLRRHELDVVEPEGVVPVVQEVPVGNHVRARRQVGLEGREHRLLGRVAGGHQIPHRRVEARDAPQGDLGQDEGHRHAEEQCEGLLHTPPASLVGARRILERTDHRRVRRCRERIHTIHHSRRSSVPEGGAPARCRMA